jgi:hypothetical protein
VSPGARRLAFAAVGVVAGAASGGATPATWTSIPAAAAGATATPTSTRVLELENTDRRRTTAIPLAAGEPFSVTYHHSMYDAPVTEEFTVDDAGRIVLTAVSSPSAAAREYFGLTGPGERHAVSRAMPEVVFRVAAGAPQRLRAGGVERSFLELGDHGDRLVMHAARRQAPAGGPSARAGSAAP